MAVSYNDSEDRPLDEVRGLLGDTEVSNAFFSDEAITAALDKFGSVDAATVALALRMRTRLAGKPVRMSAHGITVDYSSRIAGLDHLIARLDETAVGNTLTGGAIRLHFQERW